MTKVKIQKNLINIVNGVPVPSTFVLVNRMTMEPKCIRLPKKCQKRTFNSSFCKLKKSDGKALEANQSNLIIVINLNFIGPDINESVRLVSGY